MSAPVLIHRAAGYPLHKYAEEPHDGVCATCATAIEVGVSTESINNPTFANHAEFFKFGTYVCRACAWMYGDPKRTHRNVLVVGDELWWPMISADSATDERPSWGGLFGLLYHEPEDYPPDIPMTGVLTTDPKPRLWPRSRLASIGSPGLYVHAPDYDVSEWRTFDLEHLIECARRIRPALLTGYAKTRIYTGLLSDYAKAKKDLDAAISMERRLQEVRGSPEFVPALITTVVTKEEKQEANPRKERHGGKDEGAGDTGRIVRSSVPGDTPDKDGDRLF